MVVKINVSMPEHILKELDKAAAEAKLSRSALLAEAVRYYLDEKEEERRREKRRKAAQSILQIAEKLGAWDGTAEILKWRDAH